jgi:hypothetical protein
MLSLLRRCWSRDTSRLGMALFGARRVSSDRRAVRRFRPMLEAFEERRLPSLFTVTNLHNAGAGSLRSAIRQANTAAGADTIQFAAGLTGTIKLTSGELMITDQVSIWGPATGTLAVSGNHASRVFTIVSARATIANLSITAGNADRGGGVLNDGILRLQNVVMRGNAASTLGGAVASTSGSGAPARLTVVNSNLTYNFSVIGGGAVFNDLESTALIRNSTITTNQSTGFGAGLYNTGVTTIVTSTIVRNIQRGLRGVGGGIVAEGTVIILASTIAGNRGEGGPGGIACDGALSVMNSTIANNTALGGFGAGGIGAGVGNISISNSTITGNVDASGAATRAGGISYLGDVLKLNNTVVAQNFVTGGGPSDVRARVSSGSGNFIGSGDRFLVGITNGTNRNRVGTVGAPLDPKFEPLANNGGPTLTRLPRPGSPLINAGVNAVIATGITTDQRGFRRIKFGIVDIGAVEFGATQ